MLEPKMITQSYIPSFMEVLTNQGWLEVSHYNTENTLLVVSYDFKTLLLKPKEFSNYLYKGPLLEIDTDSCRTYIKPSVKVLSNNKICKAKELHKGDKLDRYHMFSKIEHIECGEWEGKLFSIFFGEPVYLPIKFDKDYCLITV